MKGDFAFMAGADNNTDFDDIFIDPSTFVISINGTPLDAMAISTTAVGEDAHAAGGFSFTYPTGEGGTDTHRHLDLLQGRNSCRTSTGTC